MKKLNLLNRSGMSPDGMSRKGRYSLDPILSRLCLVSLICLCMLTIGSGNAWGATTTLAGWTFTSGTAGTNYPSNNTNFNATSGTMSTNSTFCMNGSGSTWNSGTGKGYAFTSVSSVVITLKLNQKLAAGAQITLAADVFYNKASNKPVGSYAITTKVGSAAASSTGVGTTTWTLSNSLANKTSTYTTQAEIASGTTIQFILTASGSSGSGQAYFNNVTITSTTYTVTYSANSGSGTVPTDATAYCSKAIVTVKGNTGPVSRDGYTFGGWNTNTSGTGTNYTAGSGTFTITANTTLYAKWISAGTSVSLSKGSETNGTFSLSTSSVTTTSSAQTVTVTCTPDAGYYVSAISATNPATCPSAITYGGSNNSRTVTYPTGANGLSTISVTFSPIWYLKGDFNSWDASIPLTDITSNVATVDLSLSKTTAYEFKVYNAKDDTWYGNNGKIIDDISGWTFSTSEDNCQVFATVADDYTFNFNITNQQMQVIYPDMTHPNDAYVYLTKWWDCYVHYWYTDGGGDHALIDWGYDSQLSRYEEICETDYWCVPILDGYPKLIMKDAAGDPSNTTGDQTTNSNAGKYITHDGSWGWHTFGTYTITYAAGTGGSGSMSSHTDLCPGSSQALTANTYTKDHYHFTGWTANVAVKVGESTIPAGNIIADEATIKDIQSDINLTAQWTPNTYTITKTFTNVANAGLPASFTYTGSATTALNSTFTVNTTNFFLPSSITVTMGGTPLTQGTDYTYNNSTGAFTFSAVITGNIVITATATAKLKSIAITTQPTTRKYLVGESFSSTGAVVTATMGDGSTKAVTASATWTPAGALSAGTSQTVTATYTEAGIEKTATTTIDVYSVTVNKVDMDGNAIADAGVTASCSGRTLSQSVSTTNYKFNSWVLATASGTSLSTNTLTGTPTGNVVVNAKFHKPITVTWKVGSGAASGGTGEVKYGTAITALPSTPADNALASCGTNKFMGWSKSELKGTGHDAPADLFTTVGGATALTENTTYRAVFASSTSGAAANTVLFSENWTGVTASTKPSSPSASGSSVYGGASISYSWADGGTTTQTYSDGGPNGNANILISKSNGYWKACGIPSGNASKIVFTYAKSGSGTVSVSSPTSNVSVGGSSSGSYITFTDEVSTFDLEFKNTNGSNNLRLDDIEVKVYTAGTTAVDYQTGCCEAPASALSITSANSVATGGTVSLTSTGGNGGTVTWSVVNGSGTATVAGTTLTAGSIGTVTVKAHQDANTVLGTEYCAQDAEQAFTVVSSTINVTGVEVSPTTKAIVPGETFDITPTISPSNATDKSVSWTSSASDKASVSSGTVTGVAAGTATITCTTTDGSYTATCAVTVRDVTLQARDEDGNTIAAGGPGAPSRSGATITAAANAGNYVFKQWQVTNASVASTTTTPTTISNPTGAVTVTAVYYKPRVVKWSVNGNDSYNTGSPTTTVAYNGTISTVPDDPDGLACASTFVAWTDAAHNNGQTAKDDDSYYESKLFTDAGDFPNITAETTTFYAVFAEGGGAAVNTVMWSEDWTGATSSSGSGTPSPSDARPSAQGDHSGKTVYGGATITYTDGTGTYVRTNENNAGGTVPELLIKANENWTISGIPTGGAATLTLEYRTNGTLTVSTLTDNVSIGTKSGSNPYTNTITVGSGVTSFNLSFTQTSNRRIDNVSVKVASVSLTNYVTECDANIVKVTYDANGGSTSCTNTTTDKTEDFTVCSSAPTRDYYTFAGWLCSADSKTYAASATIPAAAIDADFTLTAQWNPVTYNITYNLYGGTNSGSNPATYNVTTATITLQDPTKGHDRFEGWYSTYSAGVYSDQVTSIPLGSHADITLHAKWAARHEIIFDADGATTTIYRADDEDLSASVAGQGSVPSDPSAPTACSTKVFVGWSESTIDGETDTEPGDLMKPAAGTVDEDKHYYAVWANESSESGTVYLYNGSFEQVTSGTEYGDKGKWTTSKVYGTGTAGEVRMSSGSASGSMDLDLSDKTLATTITVTFKMKRYGTEAGTVTLSCMDDGSTASFGSSPFSYPSGDDNWHDYSSTVTSVNNAKTNSIHFTSTSGKRVYVKDVVVSQIGTVYSYSAYSTSCCATNVTLSHNSPSNGTIAFGKTTVPTCGEDKEVSLTITPAAGYQLHSYEVATGGGKVATKSVSPAISLDNNSSAAQNITLTFAENANGAYDVTAAFSLMTVTSWTWTMHDGGGAVPNPLNLYVGQSARLDVAYTPAGVDASKKTYTRDKDNTYINWVGGLQSGYSTISGRTSTGENTTAVTFTHADGPSTTVNVKVLPLPLTHFVDLVHGKAFPDVAATIVENALNATKSTPTSDDWTTPNANKCEENHLHLVGWIREDWPALVNYLNGTGDAPSTAAIIGAGNDGSDHAYYIAAGASINVQIFDGVTFYAVWAEIK